MKQFALIFVALLVAGIWLIHSSNQNPLPLQPAEPRAVTARGDLAADELNTIEIFKNNSPAVVYVTSIALRRGLFSLNAVEIPQGTGSGFTWDTKGRIVTNYHVISDANKVQVTMADHSTWKAALVGAAPDKDLAVLQISAPEKQLHPIAVGASNNLLVGQKVFAIGNPFGLDQTITSGIISALGREINAITGRTISGMIQTDAAINPGNSGGPLLDSAGRLIGVNTAIYSPSGAYAGIGFAVPVDEVNRVIPQLIRHGRLIRPGMGATLADEHLTQRLGVRGVLVLNVEENGPAAKAGIRPTVQSMGDILLGDIITAINGRSISNYNELRDELDKHAVGDEVQLSVLREQGQIEVRLQLAAIN